VTLTFVTDATDQPLLFTKRHTLSINTSTTETDTCLFQSSFTSNLCTWVKIEHATLCMKTRWPCIFSDYRNVVRTQLFHVNKMWKKDWSCSF